MTKTKLTVQAMRNGYRMFMLFCGLDAAEFKRACEHKIGEIADGEPNDYSPESWLRAASEVAWEVGSNYGRNKARAEESKKLAAHIYGW